MMERNIKPIIDFSPYIAEHTRDFIGRVWVFKSINDWFANPDGSRFFLLSGEPGSGKTAIASRLGQFARGEAFFDNGRFITPGFLKAFHFCSARDRHWINPRNFILSLAGQLASCYPAYAKALPEAVVGRQIHLEVEQNIQQVTDGRVAGFVINKLEVNSDILPEDLFDQFVREPLEALFRSEVDQQVIILVDALDEALLYSGKINIISLLAQANNLPTGVRFILTSRQDERVENQFLEADGLSLSTTQSDQDNQEDIREYVKKRLRGKQEFIQKIALVKSTPLVELEEKVIHKAAGNFQYVSFLLDAVAKNQQSLTDLEELPAGLDGLYFLSLERVISLGKYDWKDYAPLMGVLSVAQESLTLVQLQAFLKKEVDTVWAYLGDLLQFIEEMKAKGEEKSYRLYHQSVIDFLHRQSLVGEKKEQRNSFYLSADQWHAQIIDYYRIEGSTWLNLDWKRADTYGLRYLATHLSMLRTREAYRKDLYTLICKPFMEEKQTRFGSHKPFAEDITLTIEVAECEEPPNLVQIVRGSLLYTTLGSLATNIAPEALAVLAQMDEAAKALGIAALMQDPKKQSYAYRLIGNALLSQRNLDNACVALSKALMAAQGIEDTQDKANALGDIAQKLAQADQFDQALEVATVIEIEQDKATALSGIIKMSIQTKNEEQVLNIAKQSLEISIEDYKAKSIILHAIVQNLVRMGKHNRALMLVQSIGDKRIKISALREIIYALTKEEKKEQAITIVLQMMQESEVLSKLEIDRGSEGTGMELSIFIKMVQVLAQARLFDQALLIAEKVWDKENKTNILDIVGEGLEALIEIGETEKAANLVHLALIVVEAMRSGQKNMDVLLGVARSLIQTEQFTSALEVTKAIWDEQDRVTDLSAVVEALSKAGEEEKAIFMANHVLMVADAVKIEPDRVAALEMIIRTLAFIGNFDQMLIEAEKIEDEEIKVKVLREVAQTLAEDKQFDQALKVVEMIRNKRNKAALLSKIVEVLAQLGERERTVKVADQVLVAVGVMEDEGTRISALRKVVHALVQAKQFDQALKIVDEMRDESDKAVALSEMVLALALSGEREHVVTVAKQAVVVIKELGNRLAEKSSLKMIVQALAEAGQINQMLMVAEELGDKWTKAAVLKEVAFSLTQTMQFSKALDVVKVIWNERDKVLALQVITQALTQIGETKQAVTIANLTLATAKAIWVERERTSTLQEIAKDFAQLGQLNQAISAALAIGDDYPKANALREIAYILAQAGEKRQAVTIACQALKEAEVIRDKRDKAIIEGKVAQVLAQVEEKEQALTIANHVLMNTYELENEQDKANVLKEIVQVFIQTEQLNQALGVARTIWSEGVQADVLREMVWVFIQAKQFNQALAAAGAIWNESVQMKIHQELVQTLIQIEQFDYALMAVKAIEDEDVRVALHRELVQALIQARQFDQALIAVEVIRNNGARASILNEVLQGMIGLGEKERAAITANQALDLTGTFINGWGKTSVLRKIALALAQVTLIDRAIEVAEAIDDDLDKLDTLSKIALALARIGQCDQAITIVEMIENQWVEVTTLREITRILIQRRENDRAVDVAKQALAIAEMIGDEGILSDILNSLAQALTQAKQFDQALVIVETIRGQWSKAKAFREVIQVLIQDGEKERAATVTNWAVAVIQGIRGELNNTMAFQEVVLALVLIEQFDQALAMAELIRDRESKGAALQVVALALAQSGQCDNALAVTEMIKDKGSKVVALREVVVALAKVGEKERAAVIASQALAVAETIKDKGSKVVALREAALALALVGEKENTIAVVSQALAIAETIKNQWGKESEFKALAHLLIQEGQCDQALTIAEAMRDERNKLEMLSCIAQVLINREQLDQALAVVVRIDNKGKKMTVLSKIAQHLTQRGQHEKALWILQTAFAIARQVGRESVYEVLEFGAITLSLIDQGQTLWSIYEAIREIDSWWGAK